jgi:hypothetical protein
MKLFVSPHLQSLERGDSTIAPLYDDLVNRVDQTPGLCDSQGWWSRRRRNATVATIEGSTNSHLNGGRHGNHRERNGRRVLDGDSRG